MKNNLTFIGRLVWPLFAVFFFVLPFERIPTFEVSGFTIKASYLVALLIIFLSLPQLPKILGRLSADEKILSVFWLAGLVSSLAFALSLRRALIIVLMWAFVFIIYLILNHTIKTAWIDKIKNIIITNSVIVTIFGLYQFIADSLGLSNQYTGLTLPYTNIVLGYPRVQSVALEPLFFANFLLIPIFLTAGKYLKSEKIFEKYWLILALFLTAFVLTVSRGAYLALGISGVIFIMFLLAHKHFRKVLGIISALIIAIAISFCGIKYLNGNLAGEYALNHSVSYLQDTESDSSALDRIRTFRLAWDYFKERPALGNGLGSFGFIVPMLGADKYQTVNNIYLEILTETGVIGALLFALFIIYYVLTSIAAIRKNKKGINRLSSYGLLLGILAIFIQYNFFSTLYIIYVWAFMALLRREAVGEET